MVVSSDMVTCIHGLKCDLYGIWLYYQINVRVVACACYEVLSVMWLVPGEPPKCWAGYASLGLAALLPANQGQTWPGLAGLTLGWEQD